MAESIQFHGYAALKEGKTVEPFSYTPRPLGPLDVQIRITHCGICGSDLHQLTGGWGRHIYPMLPGHEIVGFAEKLGEGVKDISIGDRVGVGPNCFSCMKDTCKECSTHNETYCSQIVDTYDHRYPDGTQTFGGYADRVRVHSRFVFKIPPELSSAGAAPLLCAGVTTYSPFKNLGVRKGDKVGVLGIGGLGHLGLQWAKALGCEVWALSSSDRKKEDARKLGADHYLNISDPKQIEENNRRLDFILAAGNDASLKWGTILSLLNVDGTCCLVGIPETDIKFNPFDIIGKRVRFVGSAVGGRADFEDMFKLAVAHKIESWVQVYPLEKVNEALKDLEEGKPRFRFVLEISK
eukprot:TRINITY_DN1782_c0_g1_i1.p1 TRINITY_DN1782_c0_g1~~TRINITY_DN1782_c0_g1_i1.p1  ORF type:complete len:351 (+),score=82.95 TRINITY_DN1782_c0_g1_i1:201-1253(+)